MPLTDVQWVLGHAQLTTTQLYLNPPTEDVIAGVLAHHARQHGAAAGRRAGPAPGYRPESLQVLFGRTRGDRGRPPAAGAVSFPRQAGIPQAVSGTSAELLARFPPRPAAASWPATRQPGEQVLARLRAPPFSLEHPASGQAGGSAWSLCWTGWTSSRPAAGRTGGWPAAPKTGGLADLVTAWPARRPGAAPPASQARRRT